MLDLLSVIDLRFIFFVLAGSLAGLVVGAMPGLSVTMATALLVSVTYTWSVNDALAMIMGVYVVGVFSGAVSAILINIPGAPSSVATTLDGFPMAQQGRAKEALFIAVIYSFIGTVFGFLALWITAKPISSIALQFAPMDYFLLAFFGLMTVGSLTSKNFIKGLISAALGVLISLVGIDPIMGTPRFAFGNTNLNSGIQLVAALIGLFGFAEILAQVGENSLEPISAKVDNSKINLKSVLRHLPLGLGASAIGTVIGALPGAGGPVASLLAYDWAKGRVKHPEVPFGEGAQEGIVASESANNACIGGALIPMLTLAVPGDAVTAVLLAVFYVHGLKPGPLMMTESPEVFAVIMAGGLLGCIALLLLGLTIAPQIARLVQIPKRILMPIVAVLCIVGAFAGRSSLFDVGVMLAFGVLGYLMRQHGFSTAPMVLGIVLGQLMDSNFRRAVSLAGASPNFFVGMFGRPITIVLTVITLCTILANIPSINKIFHNK